MSGFLGSWFPARLGGGNSKYFLFSSLPGGNDPIWLIFFKWVETTNQKMLIGFLKDCSYKDVVICCNLGESLLEMLVAVWKVFFGLPLRSQVTQNLKKSHFHATTSMPQAWQHWRLAPHAKICVLSWGPGVPERQYDSVDGSEIPNNHQGCIAPLKILGINYQPQLVNAGFLNHQQLHPLHN